MCVCVLETTASERATRSKSPAIPQPASRRFGVVAGPARPPERSEQAGQDRREARTEEDTSREEGAAERYGRPQGAAVALGRC